MLIVYKTSWPTYFLGRLMIRIPMVGLVNVVAAAEGGRTRRLSALAGEKVVPEFIQGEATPDAIAKEALELWKSAARRDAMKQSFKKIRASLGTPGAAARAAQAVLQELHQR